MDFSLDFQQELEDKDNVVHVHNDFHSFAEKSEVLTFAQKMDGTRNHVNQIGQVQKEK